MRPAKRLNRGPLWRMNHWSAYMKPAPRPREYQCGDCVSREDASCPPPSPYSAHGRSAACGRSRSFPVVRRYCLFGTLVFVPSHISVSYHLTSAGLLRQTLREAALRRPCEGRSVIATKGTIVGLAVALGSGLLIGVERERRKGEGPDGHVKLLHLWPPKLLQAGRADYAVTGVNAMRAAASLSR